MGVKTNHVSSKARTHRETTNAKRSTDVPATRNLLSKNKSPKVINDLEKALLEARTR